MTKILIVEDNPRISRGVKTSLELNHFNVIEAPTLAKARQTLTGVKVELIILDVNLPDGSGMEFCEEVRKVYEGIPIIMLTARADENSVVEGFEKGATDYVRKPFGNRELMARVKMALDKAARPSKEIQFGDLILELGGKVAMYHQTKLNLTPSEFKLLTLLVRRTGDAVSRDEILTLLGDEGDTMDRTIDSHVSHLRSKLKQVTKDAIKISAVYGLGYRLEKK